MIHLETVTPENWRLGLRVREDQRRPGNTDRCGLFDGFLRFDGEETYDDMRHTEVAEPPAEA